MTFRGLIEQREDKMTYRQKLIEDQIRGLHQDIALRQRYQKDGFGLESVFDKRERAMTRISELKQTYGLKNADIRLVENRLPIGGSGERVVWQVFAKHGKGVKVRFFD